MFLLFGEPKTRFLVESDEGQWFRTSVEKIDFVVKTVSFYPIALPTRASEACAKPSSP